MKFNSQLCTTREQSQRLLSLGIKAETADMVWMSIHGGHFIYASPWSNHRRPQDIPAWSLHRLAFLLNASPYPIYLDSNAYSDIIDDIEELIRHGEFNKEYLV